MAERGQDSSQDEPSFEEVNEQELSAPEPEAEQRGAPLPEEPHFESEPAPGPAVAPAGSAYRSGQDKDEYGWFDAQSADGPATPGPRHLGRTGPFWWIAGAVLALTLILVWLGVSQNRPTETPFELTDTPATGLAGGITIEAESPPTPTPLPEPTPEPLLTEGQEVVVANTDGDGIRLRGEPSLASVTLEIFAEGSEFTILNPGSEYEEYPVESDGYGWYRIRATSGEDSGLVGWAAGDFLAPTSE